PSAGRWSRSSSPPARRRARLARPGGRRRARQRVLVTAAADRGGARRHRPPTPAAAQRRSPRPHGRRAQRAGSRPDPTRPRPEATMRRRGRGVRQTRPAMAAPDPTPAPTSAPTGWRAWLAGARPRTLPAAAVPVLVGTACAVGEADEVVPWRAAAAGVVALMLQVGTNYANDYSDGVRGTDEPGLRVGPVRLVGWGLTSPAEV